MYKKCFKTHAIALILGVLFFLVQFILEEFFNQSKFSFLLRIAIILSFTVTMFCYYKIISTMKKVTDITQKQVFFALLSHALTFVALILWQTVPLAVPMTFIGSIIIRRCAGINEIDGQMEGLCQQLDSELYKIKMDQLDKKR